MQIICLRIDNYNFFYNLTTTFIKINVIKPLDTTLVTPEWYVKIVSFIGDNHRGGEGREGRGEEREGKGKREGGRVRGREGRGIGRSIIHCHNIIYLITQDSKSNFQYKTCKGTR